MTATGGVATAQTGTPLDDVIGQIEDALGDAAPDEGDTAPDEGEADEGPTGTPLDDLLGALDPSQLEDLQEQLDPSQLEELLEMLGLDSLQDLAPEEEAPEGEEPDPADTEEGTAEAGEVPGTDLGGFVGTARGTGLEIGVGLPAELADPLEPLLDGLGIRDADTGGIRIALADTQAELRRAAEGEEVEGLAKALVTNLLLDSEAAGSPGSCTGGDTVELPPDQDIPLLSITLAGIDCEQTDERAFADVQVAGANISLAGLIEAGLPGDVADGLDQVLEPLNQELLGALNDNCEDALGAILNPLLPDNQACDALNLQISNPFDLDIPVVDVDLLGSTSEVTANDDEVTADAQSTLAGINVLGLVCVGGDGTDPVTFSASAATDGETATTDTNAPNVQTRLCANEASILRLIPDAAALQEIDLLEENITNLVDGALDPVFEGVESLLDALNTAVLTQGAPYETTDGAGAVAGVDGLEVAATAPLADIPGLNEFLGDLSVTVKAMDVEAAVNADPSDPVIPSEEQPPAEPESTPQSDLPTTGGAAGLLGLAALGAAAALRRRED